MVSYAHILSGALITSTRSKSCSRYQGLESLYSFNHEPTMASAELPCLLRTHTAYIASNSLNCPLSCSASRPISGLQGSLDCLLQASRSGKWLKSCKSTTFHQHCSSQEASVATVDWCRVGSDARVSTMIQGMLMKSLMSLFKRTDMVCIIVIYSFETSLKPHPSPCEMPSV